MGVIVPEVKGVKRCPSFFDVKKKKGKFERHQCDLDENDVKGHEENKGHVSVIDAAEEDDAPHADAVYWRTEAETGRI